MNADDEDVLRRLLEAYLPAPPREVDRERGHAMPPAATAGPQAVHESLDEYQRVFFAEGATLAYVEAVTAPWRASGLTAPEVREWLDAGVYPDEPGLAVALAGAGFDPREARQTTIRYRADSELLNVISAVRGRTEQADWAVALRAGIAAVRGPGIDRRTG